MLLSFDHLIEKWFTFILPCIESRDVECTYHEYVTYYCISIITIKCIRIVYTPFNMLLHYIYFSYSIFIYFSSIIEYLYYLREYIVHNSQAYVIIWIINHKVRRCKHCFRFYIYCPLNVFFITIIKLEGWI